MAWFDDPYQPKHQKDQPPWLFLAFVAVILTMGLVVGVIVWIDHVMHPEPNVIAAGMCVCGVLGFLLDSVLRSRL